MRIAIDAGHGGHDSGAAYKGLLEKDIVLNISTYVFEIMDKRCPKCSYILTRANDSFVELSERSALANEYDADMFISIHCNAAENQNAKGFETFVHPSVKHSDLQQCVHNSLADYWQVDRGMKKENFSVLRKTRMPAALIELGFLSNIENRELIDTKEEQYEIANRIANGLCDYIDLLEK